MIKNTAIDELADSYADAIGVSKSDSEVITDALAEAQALRLRCETAEAEAGRLREALDYALSWIDDDHKPEQIGQDDIRTAINRIQAALAASASETKPGEREAEGCDHKNTVVYRIGDENAWCLRCGHFPIDRGMANALLAPLQFSVGDERAKALRAQAGGEG